MRMQKLRDNQKQIRIVRFFLVMLSFVFMLFIRSGMKNAVQANCLHASGVCGSDGSCGTGCSCSFFPGEDFGACVPDNDPGCFPAGTEVEMADGSVKNIEEVEVGDRVVNQNEDGVQGMSMVKELKTPVSTNMCEISYTDGGTLKLTDNHTMSTTTGWRAINPEAARAEIPSLTIGQLEEGDEIYVSDGGVAEVESYSCWSARQQTYNLVLDGSVNTYFADGYLAHNKGAGDHTYWECENSVKTFEDPMRFLGNGPNNQCGRLSGDGYGPSMCVWAWWCGQNTGDQENMCSTCSCYAAYCKGVTCDSATPESPTTSATSGNFYIYVDSDEATSVEIAVWTAVNGQDDLVWYDGVNMGGGLWRGTIDLARHPEYGAINVHVYMDHNVWCGTANFTRALCGDTQPGTPSLIGPANNSSLTTLTTTLDWSGVDFGTSCSGNVNEYLVYVEAGDGTPDVLVATLGSGTTSYDFTGTVDGRYYWQIVASNGARTTGSAVRSFYTPGLVTGTLFDASDVDTCALMAGEAKISGATVDLVSASNSYSPTTNGSGIYTSYVNTPDSYIVSPVVGEPYSATPKLVCQGSSADFVSTGATITRDFGFWRVYGGWWQVVGGDVYGGGGVESVIPDSLPANEKYLVKEDADGADGLVYYDAGGEVVLGGGSDMAVSSSGWESESGYEGQDINYAYYMAKMKTLGKTAWDGLSKPAYSPVDGYEVYTHTGNITIDYDFSINSDEKRIYMIDGNVVVDRAAVTVALGSHLTVIASGTITFADNVGEIHGWWMGERIVIASTGNTATEIQFIGEGSFIGWSSIEFNRDRGVTNNTAPAEEFTYRPDFMVNAPDALKFSKYKWLEQTP